MPPQQAADRGLRVYTIGFGTRAGRRSSTRPARRSSSGGEPAGGGFGGGGGGGGGGGFRRGIDEDTLWRSPS